MNEATIPTRLVGLENSSADLWLILKTIKLTDNWLWKQTTKLLLQSSRQQLLSIYADAYIRSKSCNTRRGATRSCGLLWYILWEWQLSSIPRSFYLFRNVSIVCIFIYSRLFFSFFVILGLLVDMCRVNGFVCLINRIIFANILKVPWQWV